MSEDLIQERRIFYGYGYKSIIPQMQDPSAPGRLGMDGLNEHVHNYFVTVYSRGGILQLLLFILLHISLIKIWKNNNANMKILIYYLPIIFVSSLDISMDGVQFPLIFYSFLIFKKSIDLLHIKYKKKKNFYSRSYFGLFSSTK